jgi:hypothetical protein
MIKMREPADHHDAELMLQLYDLRREEKLRAARDWFLREFHVNSAEDLYKRYPSGSKENEYYRMVVSYWDMASSIVNRGLINDELFFENNGECWAVWTRIKDLVPSARAMWKNPHLHHNLERLAERYEKWSETRAPGALDLMRERLKNLSAKK